MRRAFREVEELYARPPIPTGLARLDDAILGWRPGMLTMIEGNRIDRTASDFLLHMALCRLANRTAIAYFCVDLSAESVLIRMMTINAGLELEALQAGEQRPWARFIREAATLNGLPIYMNSHYELSPALIEEACSKLAATVDRCVIFIDSIHGLSADSQGFRANDSSPREVVHQLARVAKRLRLPIVASAYSGAIGPEEAQDLNLWMTVRLEEPDADPEPEPDYGPSREWPHEAVIQVLANAYGPTITFSVQYEPRLRVFDGFRWS